jgi:type IV pilus assembly protein PilO
LIIGSGIAVLMSIVLYLPLLYQVNSLGRLVQGLTDKVALLPPNRQRLSLQLQNFELARAQEDLLLKLVAGSGQLQTLQAKLSQLAGSSGVVISGFEPRLGESPGTPAATSAASASPVGKGRPTAESDPLVSAGLRKKSVLLTVKGSYPDLKDFLVAVENLNVIAIATELKLKTDDFNPSAMLSAILSQDQQTTITTMTLVLSTYDRPGLDPVKPMGLQPRPPGAPTP